MSEEQRVQLDAILRQGGLDLDADAETLRAARGQAERPAP